MFLGPPRQREHPGLALSLNRTGSSSPRGCVSPARVGPPLNHPRPHPPRTVSLVSQLIFRLRPLRSHLWGPAPGPSCLPLYPQIQRRARHENRYIINACFNSERTALYSGRSVFMSAAYSVHASLRGRWFLAPFEDEQTGAQRGEGTCLRSQSREVAGLEHEPRSLRCQTSCSSTQCRKFCPWQHIRWAVSHLV